MRKLLAISIALSILLAVNFSNGAEIKRDSSTSPDIVVSEESWDFGEINEGEKVTHIFKIMNTGNDKLIIKKVRSSCGCTAALISSKTIDPGKISEVEVTFDPTQAKGKFLKHVYVESNDPDEPSKQLAISGEIRALPSLNISIQPISLGFEAISLEKESIYKFLIKNIGEGILSIPEIKTSSESVSVSISSEEIKAGESVEGTLKIKPQKGKKEIKEYLYLKIPIDIEIKEGVQQKQ